MQRKSVGVRSMLPQSKVIGEIHSPRSAHGASNAIRPSPIHDFTKNFC